MTSDAGLPAYGATSDAFGSNRAVTTYEPPQPVRFNPNYRRATTDPDTGITTTYWELVFSDLRGKPAQYGPLKMEGHGSAADDSVVPLDRRYTRSLTLPPKVYSTTMSSGWGDAGPVASEFIFNVLLVAIGGTANKALFRLTNTHDTAGASDHDIATLTSLTYTPGGVIFDLVSAVILVTRRLAVLRAGLTIQWLTTAADTPGTTGTEHANLVNTYWMCETPLYRVYQAGQVIYNVTVDSAIGTAPTAVTNFIKAGGWGGWLRKLRGDAVPYIFAIEPLDASVGVSVIGTSARTRLIRCLIDGTLVEHVQCPLHTIAVAGPWQDELFLSDGKTAYLYDGERFLHLDWRENLAGDATIEGYWADAQGMFLKVRRFNSDATLYTRVVLYWEAASNTCYPVQIGTTDSNQLLMAPGPMPSTPEGTAGNGGAIFDPAKSGTDLKWYEQWRPPPGYNPYWLSQGRPTPMPEDYGMGFEASASYTGPYLEFEGMEGYEKVVDGIWCGGNINDAGTTTVAGYATISFGGYTVTFTADGEHNYPLTNYYAPQSSEGRFYQGQLAITGARCTGDENWTPQILPITVRGRCFIPPAGQEPAPSVGTYGPYGGSGALPPGMPPVVAQPQRKKR